MTTGTYDLHLLIEEARRRARLRRWTYAGILALLAGAGIWGGLALTSGSEPIPARLRRRAITSCGREAPSSTRW